MAVLEWQILFGPIFTQISNLLEAKSFYWKRSGCWAVYLFSQIYAFLKPPPQPKEGAFPRLFVKKGSQSEISVFRALGLLVHLCGKGGVQGNEGQF